MRLALCIPHLLLIVLEHIPVSQPMFQQVCTLAAYCISSKPSGGGFVLDVLIFGIVVGGCSDEQNEELKL
jgi:hypothetical protein